MKRVMIIAIGFLSLVLCSCQKDTDEDLQCFDSNGASNALFSIGYNKQVRFSKGNLQYQASTRTWRFAEHQYDRIGEDNSNISATYEGWIDLFGWGTSGWNSGATCYQPWSNSTDYSDYLPGGSNASDLTGNYANADWGVYNAISNGGNRASIWRVLTKEEWNYLFFERSGTYRWAKAKVNDICVVIIFPDNFNKPSEITIHDANNYDVMYRTNIYDNSQSTLLQNAGCILLPAEGYRYGLDADLVAMSAYWSSSKAGGNCAWTLDLFDKYVRMNSHDISTGRYVRLVMDAE